MEKEKIIDLLEQFAVADYYTADCYKTKNFLSYNKFASYNYHLGKVDAYNEIIEILKKEV